MSAPEALARAAFKQTIERCAPAIGSTFTLAGHVYEVALPPEIGPQESILASGDWAYVCMPLYDDNDQYSPEDASNQFDIPLTGFVGETSSNPQTSTAAARVLNLKHDIRSVLKGNHRLDGTCASCVLVSSQSLAGWPSKGIRYGEVRMTYRVILWGA